MVAYLGLLKAVTAGPIYFYAAGGAGNKLSAEAV